MNEDDIEYMEDKIAPTVNDWLHWLKEVDDAVLKLGNHYLWYDEEFDGQRRSNWIVGRKNTSLTAHQKGPYLRSMIDKYDVEPMDGKEVSCYE